MEADFLHEVVHGILDHLGYKDHNEKKVDEMAQSLYMVIQDNPQIFEGGDSDAGRSSDTGTD